MVHWNRIMQRESFTPTSLSSNVCLSVSHSLTLSHTALSHCTLALDSYERNRCAKVRWLKLLPSLGLALGEWMYCIQFKVLTDGDSTGTEQGCYRGCSDLVFFGTNTDCRCKRKGPIPTYAAMCIQSLVLTGSVGADSETWIVLCFTYPPPLL